jgi:hypothetical protein
MAHTFLWAGREQSGYQAIGAVVSPSTATAASSATS